MKNYPMITKVLCVAAVACVMLPAGRMIFPHIADLLGNTEFSALQAVLSATLGFGLYTALFG